MRGLKVRDVVVPGHTDCGAMRALIDPARMEGMPRVAKWLEHAHGARRVVTEGYANADPDTRLMAAIEANVLAQIENLQSYPVVAEARAEGRLAKWLEHAHEARRVVTEGYANADPDTRLMAAIEADVLAQIENLQSYPVVAEARAEGRLALHGWVWHIDTGAVHAFDAATGTFEPLRSR